MAPYVPYSIHDQCGPSSLNALSSRALKPHVTRASVPFIPLHIHSDPVNDIFKTPSRYMVCFNAPCGWDKLAEMSPSGGGINGLFLAVAPSRQQNIKIDFYGVVERFEKIGVGVRTWRILDFMGLASEFSKVAHSPPNGSMGMLCLLFRYTGVDNVDRYWV